MRNICYHAFGLAIALRLILDSRVVIGQVWRNRLFLQAFPGGLDRCGIFGKSRLISSASVLYRVCKTPESNMSHPRMDLAGTAAIANERHEGEHTCVHFSTSRYKRTAVSNAGVTSKASTC